MLGAISVEVAGKPAGEFGPGSFVSIPSGAKYALTTTAAGECTFLLQQADSAAAEVLWKARKHRLGGHGRDQGGQERSAVERRHLAPTADQLGAARRSPARRPRGVLVMLGAISVEIAGKSSGEFGPGSFVSIPAGAKYALTTTAAGECTFLLQ
jgi:glyoxylate utilization-related uncharacterized protein